MRTLARQAPLLFTFVVSMMVGAVAGYAMGGWQGGVLWLYTVGGWCMGVLGAKAKYDPEHPWNRNRGASQNG